MPSFRTVVSAVNSGIGAVTGAITYQIDEHSSQGVWARPKLPALVFSDNRLLGTTLANYGGAIAGASGGTPVQLIFWGAWWKTAAGMLQQTMIEARTKALLDSSYFSELAQYGIPRAPVFRGAVIVSEPTPPGAVSSKQAMDRTLDLIDDLIDDDVFPDPDDGPRIAFLVLMPMGFSVVGGGVAGAHSSDYDFDFPFDSDNYWAGWVRFFDPAVEDPERTMLVLSHELVELLTDPEGDGWHTEVNSSVNEISDAGFSGSIPQCAYVNGALAQSYWSNRHAATVLPIDQDYAARLTATVKETARSVVDRGTFRPAPSDSAACSTELPECCMEDRDYRWEVFGIDETARIQVITQRFRSPVETWTINGQKITGLGSITLNLPVDGFEGRRAVTTTRDVTLDYTAGVASLTVVARGARGNFDVQVGCSVIDASFAGLIAVNLVAMPVVTVGFVGAQLRLEDEYTRQRSACLRALLRRYIVQVKPTGRPGRGDPINFDPGEFTRDLPAHVRPGEFQRVQETAKGVRAAFAMLPREVAVDFARSVAADVPALERRFAQYDVGAIVDALPPPLVSELPPLGVASDSAVAA